MKRILIVVTLTLGLAYASSGQMIGNGSFEDTVTGPCEQGFAPYAHYLFPWIISANYIELWCHGNIQASHGGASIHLSGHSGSPSSIYQDLPTVAGVVYQVTFEMSGIDGQKTMTITADNAQAANYEYTDQGNTLTNMNWATKVYSFTAADGSTRLMFTSTTSGIQGPFIDNVSAIARAGMVCHTNNGGGQPRTLALDEGWAFWAHTQHGDQMGACP